MTEEETLQMIETLPHGKATGPDDISVKVLKLAVPAFCHPLTKFFNLSLQNGYFPRKGKIARVTPLYKNGTRDNKNNYRPISVLSMLSKLLEKHVAQAYMKYLEQNGLLYHLQSAFREGYFTETALIKITDQILFNLDSDEVTALIFVNFKKAFDVVDHELLHKKLELYRVGDVALSWFGSYLSEHSQFVALNGSLSKRLEVKQAVRHRDRF